jgi:hypothetical protein
MKLYTTNIYGPDTYEGDDTLFGVFNSIDKYMEAIQNFADTCKFEFTEDDYTVEEVELNKSYF